MPSLIQYCIDDFTRTGEFNREELDETTSAIMRLLYGHKLTGYTFDPRLSDAMRNYIDKWQNPETGCWGQWVVDRYGRVWKMDDTGITFHVISDLHGQVQHLTDREAAYRARQARLSGWTAHERPL